MPKLRKPTTTALLAVGALLVLAATALALNLGGSASAEPVKIEVFARKYSWRFGYPHANGVSKELRVPIGHPIEFEIHAANAVHGFWVPEWKVNVEAVPGEIEELTVTPDTAGVYQVICSESCGLLHTSMHAKLVVQEPAQFAHWLGGLHPIPAVLENEAHLDRETRAIRESVAGGESH